jgi:anti-sigma factor RsiW
VERHPADLLTAYVDDALPPEVAVGVAAHLAECEHCRTVADDLQAVRTLVRTLPEPVPAASLWSRTLARLAPAAPRPRRGRWWLAGAAAGAAGIAVVLHLPVPDLVAPRGGGAAAQWHLQRHAEAALEHPLADVTLATYLSGDLPYTTTVPDAGR